MNHFFFIYKTCYVITYIRTSELKKKIQFEEETETCVMLPTYLVLKVSHFLITVNRVVFIFH